MEDTSEKGAFDNIKLIWLVHLIEAKRILFGTSKNLNKGGKTEKYGKIEQNVTYLKKKSRICLPSHNLILRSFAPRPYIRNI